MKTILLLAAIACLPAHASIPVKAPLVKYTGLWTNSPFTSKPPPQEPGITVNPFEDFTLTGIAPVPGGYRITIMSKKNPDVKEVIQPGVESEFKVVSVNRNPEKPLGTTVVLSSGAIQGTVSFEPDLITLKAAPAAPVAPQGNPNLPPGVANPNQPPPPTQAGQNPGDPSAQRQPRPRIVPPQSPGANPQQQQPQTQGGRPSGNERRDYRRR
jgi:hypothetical protein